jgi:sulfhydrogenase subunit gamma (sulfur reductase)
MIDLLKTDRAEVLEVVDEAPGLKTFVLRPREPMDFRPGQFVLVSRYGAGESVFAISSDPAAADSIAVSVQAVGKHTKALHEVDPGESLGLRGPYGNSFPIEEWKGKHVWVIGGGIGLAPLRPVIYTLLARKDEFASLSLVYGARRPELLVYKPELERWRSGMDVHLTVDEAPDGTPWDGSVGVVPKVLTDLGVSPGNAVAVVCGPPIMIRFSHIALSGLGFSDDQIYTTLEMKMKCGVGLCGRCNTDHRYICKDGPVFRMDEIGQPE